MSLHTIAAIAAAFCALLAVASAGFDTDMNTIFAVRGSTPAGFEATKKAVVSVVDEIIKSQEASPATDPMFDLLFARLRDYRDVCVLNKAHCEHNLELLVVLVEVEDYNDINLQPYLKRCQEEQKAFCA